MTKRFNQYTDKNYVSLNTWHCETSIWKAKNIKKILKRNKITPRNICEVGCGGGEILINLQNLDGLEQLHGYEISDQAFLVNKKKQNKKISFYKKDVFKINNFYDVLISSDVFEHVEDYFGFIRENKKKAVYKVFHIPLEISIATIISGGLVYARKKVGHIHHFLFETALETLKDSDLEIVDYFITAPFETNGPPLITLREKILKYPRRIIFMISPKLCSKTIGGCSLMVLTK